MACSCPTCCEQGEASKAIVSELSRCPVCDHQLWNRIDRWILLVLVVLSSLLVLPGLGQNRLWCDEAHTAVLARNIMINGLPVASDGRNLLTIFNDNHDIRDGIYIWQPWLPAYLVATSMSFFGTETFGARLPFALSFILLIGVSYRIFRCWHSERQVALLSAVAMMGCVPLLLHARQCRYYLLVPLFSLLAVHAYKRLHAKPRIAAAAMLTLWFTLLFNAFYPAAFVLAVSLGIDVGIRRPNRQVMLTFVIAAVAFLIINSPIAIYCRIWDRKYGVESGYSNFDVFSMYLIRYLLTINTYFFPLILVAVAGLWHWRTLLNRKWFQGDQVLLLLNVCLVTLIAFAALSDFPFTRYLLGLLPFLFFLGGLTIWTVTGKRLSLAWMLLLIVTATNVLHVLPLPLLRLTNFQEAKWTVAGIDSQFLDRENIGGSFARGEIKTIINTPTESPLGSYLKSFRKPPQGPIDWIIDYLKRHGSPQDRVKISYGDVCLMFHTDMLVTSGAIAGPPAPEWVIIRRFNRMVMNEEFVRGTKDVPYSAVELTVPDVQWNNRPDPVYHFFNELSDELAPRVIINKKAD